MNFYKILDLNYDFGNYKIKKFNMDRENNIVLFTLNDINKPCIIYYDKKTIAKKYVLLEDKIDPEAVLCVQPIEENWLIILNCEENNAIIFNNKGKILNKFYVGSGIQDCQVDKYDNIWIGYSDEGIYGDSIIGGNGIVAFDAKGQVVFNDYDNFVCEYDVPPIDECSVMNVTNDGVWLYYYSEFPLVQIKNKKMHKIWEEIELGVDVNLGGFAVGEDNVLFVTLDKSLVLYSLTNNKVHYMVPYNEWNGEIFPINCFGRGSVLYLQTKDSLYCADLMDNFNAK